MITISCGTCGTDHEVPASAAGAKGRCRSCGATVHVPRPATARASAGAPAGRTGAAPDGAGGTAGAGAALACAECGRAAEYKDLIEFGGRMVCVACNRSRVAARRQGAGRSGMPARTGFGDAGAVIGTGEPLVTLPADGEGGDADDEALPVFAVASEADVPPAGWLNRLARGGVLGLFSERFCVSQAQLAVGGATGGQKAARLAKLAGLAMAILGVAIVLFVLATNLIAGRRLF